MGIYIYNIVGVYIYIHLDIYLVVHPTNPLSRLVHPLVSSVDIAPTYPSEKARVITYLYLGFVG